MRQEQWLERFPFLLDLTAQERNRFFESALTHALRAGQTVVQDNSSSTGVIFVLSGELKVYKVSENGRELALYDVGPGELVMLALSCIVGGGGKWTSHVSICALQDSQIAILPCAMFDALYARSRTLQRFVLNNTFSKMGEVVTLVEKLTFQTVRDRLRDYIKEHTENGKKPLYVTHAQLAARLGTSREVVTRHLRQMAADGEVAAQRGKITLTGGAAQREAGQNG